ncbi:hypothetical protein [Leifsonia shinshuensis]|uniref:hypothetical protein n=1 Tax=Leifsonia shinshuensis TaxID=150026 RepID=UPI00285C595C|nr:hypothetical protein [Leifsonia shinshuensis]MDR6971701.1 hypothetical protein [Leifsonia shinshuensis]
MSLLEPSAALSSFESALRELMLHAYKQAWGDGWLDRVSTEQQRAKWDQRRDASRSRTRRGVANIERPGLAWCECYELINIVEQNWEPVAAALGDRASTLPLLRRFDALRNDVAHSRPLVPFERDLLSGIAGEIRNRVTLYMSREASAGEIYPRIESVVDSFGNQNRPGLDAGTQQSLVRVETILHPGDVVTFECLGWDPEDRPLIWRLEGRSATRGAITVNGRSGEISQLTWNVTIDDVAEGTFAQIRLVSYAPYHRNGYYDQEVNLAYRVRPPL